MIKIISQEESKSQAPTRIGESILKIMADLSAFYRKHYIYPGQMKLLELIERREGRRISRRTLNYELKKLEQTGYFARIRRHRNDGEGNILLRTTLYILKGRFFAWMHRLVGKARKWLRFFRVQKIAQYNLQTNYILPPLATKTELPTGYQQPEQPKKDFSYKLKSTEVTDIIKRIETAHPELI